MTKRQVCLVNDRTRHITGDSKWSNRGKHMSKMKGKAPIIFIISSIIIIIIIIIIVIQVK